MNIKIEKYDNQGRGIGYLNKKIVFVPNTVIGETVEIEIVEEKDKYIVGKVINVISPSTIRIKSKCPYYDRCGGCEFMHLSMDEELRIKTNILTDLLKRNNIDVPKINVIQSNNKYNYRNKVTLKIVNNEFGYYNSGTHNFTKIDYCYLAKDSINNIIKSYNLFKVSSGEITIRSNYNDEILIKITSNEKVDVDIEKLINDNKIVGIIVNDKVIYGENDYIEKVNNYLFKVNINSFFQVNLNILEKIEKILHAKKYHNVVDLYCGVGTLGMFVNKDKLYGIEIVKDAVINASINAKINKQNNMYMLGDSSKISKIDSDIDCIIIDPPRSGLNKETMKNIVTIKPDNLIYMSCNPLTFVRDMQILNKIYNVDEFYYLEMFPRTKHMECISMLSRKAQ